MHSQSLQEVTMLLSQRLTQIQPVSVNSARSRNFVQFMRHFRKFAQSQLFTYVTLFLVAEAASWHKRLTFNDRCLHHKQKPSIERGLPNTNTRRMTHDTRDSDQVGCQFLGRYWSQTWHKVIKRDTEGQTRLLARARGVDHLLRQLLAKLVSANINRSHSDCGVTAD